MDLSIASILLLDGITNGAVYALLGLATVLVFTVTRVIFIPQGEFVAYGALTLAILQTGKVPGTVWLLLIMAAVAAMVLIGRLGAAEPTLGTLWELDAIAAAAIGGASLMGGRGSILGTLIGCIILGTLRNGLTLLNVQAFYQLLATGIIIIVAMLIDKATSGKQGG